MTYFGNYALEFRKVQHSAVFSKVVRISNNVLYDTGTN